MDGVLTLTGFHENMLQSMRCRILGKPYRIPSLIPTLRLKTKMSCSFVYAKKFSTDLELTGFGRMGYTKTLGSGFPFKGTDTLVGSRHKLL